MKSRTLKTLTIALLLGAFAITIPTTGMARDYGYKGDRHGYHYKDDHRGYHDQRRADKWHHHKDWRRHKKYHDRRYNAWHGVPRGYYRRDYPGAWRYGRPLPPRPPIRVPGFSFHFGY